MRTLVFATQNAHKVAEVQAFLGDRYQFLGLTEIGCTEELAETQPTLEGNALQKARYVYENYHQDCFSEDTGLEVTALNGEPGVYTARYAGPQRRAEDNMALLLQNLADKSDRSARFRTVIALIMDGREYLFEGIVEGTIAEEARGTAGFGYDPVFIPQGFERTFAEMTGAEKNDISHRARAIKKLYDFLKDGD